jgi:hypothetical protein
MARSQDNDRRMHVAAEGVDFSDDESIRAFAQQVWQSAVDRWTGAQVTDIGRQGPGTVLTPRYNEAIAYATAIHGTQVRKGTRTTYMCHLLGVSALVLEAGGTEEESIAALLHDAVEDAGGLPRHADIRARFGDRVAAIVLACSDSTDEQWKASVDYWVRKQAYLDKMAASQDAGALLVSIADKVHNARAIVTDIIRSKADPDGADPLARFNGTPEQIRDYYLRLLEIAESARVPDTLTIALGVAVRQIAEHVDAQQGAPR